MALIKDVIRVLEEFAPPVLQEDYDNCGLLLGNSDTEVKGILITLDTTEAVVEEAVEKGCNLIVSHHPFIFGGLRKLTGDGAVERTALSAIRHNIAVYAIHTNLDNVQAGVNATIADRLQLQDRFVLRPLNGTLRKLVTFAPLAHAAEVRHGLFAAGAGQIGAYDHCSFNITGEGSFRAGPNTQPFVGEKGQDHLEEEMRIEVIFPHWKQKDILQILREKHPYEEVAYDIYILENTWSEVGAGLVGNLAAPMKKEDFLAFLKEKMSTSLVRYAEYNGDFVQKVAVCGGSGSFLIPDALRAGADAFVTADLKYHQFFDGEGKLLLADIGHFESEQFSSDLIRELILQNFANFAPSFPVIKGMDTNPVKYY